MSMQFIEMCLQGSAMILVALVLRALLGRRLPHVTFYALWIVVLVRMVIPVAIPSPVSVWPAVESAAVGLIQGVTAATDEQTSPAPDNEQEGSSTVAAPGVAGSSVAPAQTPAASRAGGPSPWQIAGLVWAVGAISCAGVFAVLYARAYRRLRLAVPANDPFARLWAAAHRPRLRGLRLMECAGIGSPLTFGVLRPTIVVPVGFDWSDHPAASLVLAHELTHVRRLDALTKIGLAMMVSLHWFNPLAWVAYACANKDIELSCDEAVTFPMDAHGHARYASALINAQQTREKVYIVSGFSGDFFEERIGSIVRSGHRTYRGRVATTAASLALSAAVTLTLGTVGTASGIATEGGVAEAAQAGPWQGDAQLAGTVLVEAGADSELVWVDRDFDTNGTFFGCDRSTRIEAPRYAVLVPQTLVSPESVEVSFSLGGGTPAPEGASDLMIITDASTGEVEFLVYCYPRDPNFPQYTVPGELGEMPGYVQKDLGRVDSDYRYGIAVAIPQGNSDLLSTTLGPGGVNLTEYLVSAVTGDMQ